MADSGFIIKFFKKLQCHRVNKIRKRYGGGREKGKEAREKDEEDDENYYYNHFIRLRKRVSIFKMAAAELLLLLIEMS